jgi:tetratricopeptide (TPR) repeat protein
VKPELAPDQSAYDPRDEKLRAAANALQDALNASSVEQEEAKWYGIQSLTTLCLRYCPSLCSRIAGTCACCQQCWHVMHQSFALAMRAYKCSALRCRQVLVRRTQIIDKYGKEKADWVPDIVGRAYGNRGNARSRQGKLDDALRDYNKAADICPWSVDPLLNRGAVLEQLGRCVHWHHIYALVL